MRAEPERCQTGLETEHNCTATWTRANVCFVCSHGGIQEPKFCNFTSRTTDSTSTLIMNSFYSASMFHSRLAVLNTSSEYLGHVSQAQHRHLRPRLCFESFKTLDNESSCVQLDIFIQILHHDLRIARPSALPNIYLGDSTINYSKLRVVQTPSKRDICK